MGPAPDRTDEELATLARDGDRDAFEALVQRFGAALLGLAAKQVDDHLAHDLAQEIWIKVFRALHRWQPIGSFRSWLFSIALNHMRDAQRRRSRDKVVYLDQFRSPPAAPRSSNPQGRSEEQAVIAQAIGEVGEPFRTALFLVDVVGLNYEEAARTLTCAVGTVKSRVNRGRFAFRDVYVRLAGGAPAGRSEHRA